MLILRKGLGHAAPEPFLHPLTTLSPPSPTQKLPLVATGGFDRIRLVMILMLRNELVDARSADSLMETFCLANLLVSHQEGDC